MSVSESSPLSSRVHQSLEQLITETVRQSTELQERETEALKSAMRSALAELEASQLAITHAVDALRTALGDIEPEASGVEASEPAPAPAAETEPEPDPVVEATPEPIADVTGQTATAERGPHELNVIAHGATITSAAGLQGWLRSADEVSSVQTREFVNGELRLHAEMARSLNMESLNTWLNANGGRVATTTDHVIEIHFQG